MVTAPCRLNDVHLKFRMGRVIHSQRRGFSLDFRSHAKHHKGTAMLRAYDYRGASELIKKGVATTTTTLLSNTFEIITTSLRYSMCESPDKGACSF